MNKQKFKKLEIWKKSMNLIERIYKVTKDFPREEVYGLTSQIRRAAISVALNIAEGSGAESDVEFKRFLNIAYKSNQEVVCAIEISKRLEYIGLEDLNSIAEASDKLSAMLFSFIKKLKADS